MEVRGNSYKFTNHAYSRLCERGLTTENCKKTIICGKIERKKNAKGKPQLIYWDGHYKVAVDPRNNTIVTVMKCRKHSSKYKK